MADGECVNNEGWRDTENLNVKCQRQTTVITKALSKEKIGHL